jgi:hypothetical protein
MYSFGHSEYNQHGDNTRSNRDYVDAHYYFLPQQVLIEGTAATPSTKGKTGWKTPSTTGATREVLIKRISCGANYTVALDDRGDVYSWGWNESGVLGHGVRHFASAPQRIEALGASFDGCRVRALCAGGKHVVAVAEAQGHAWAASFHSILESDRHVDCVIDIHDAAADLASKYAPGRAQKGSAPQATRQTSFPCHRAILSARSTFLRGYINAALRRQQSFDAEGDERPDPSGTVLRIALPSAYANAVTVRSLLDYLYLDRVQVASHKREELKLLAEDLGIERLSLLLSGDESQLRSVPSVFTANMTQLLNSPDHADVVFVCSKSACDVPSVPAVYGYEVGQQASPHHSSQDAEVTVGEFKPSEYDFVLYAHRAVIGTRLPYFEAMLTSGFSESNRKVRVCAPFNGPQSTATLVDVGGLVEEGIDLAVLEMVLLYTYTGHFYKEVTKGKHCNTCLFTRNAVSQCCQDCISNCALNFPVHKQTAQTKLPPKKWTSTPLWPFSWPQTAWASPRSCSTASASFLSTWAIISLTMQRTVWNSRPRTTSPDWSASAGRSCARRRRTLLQAVGAEAHRVWRLRRRLECWLMPSLVRKLWCRRMCGTV